MAERPEYFYKNAIGLSMVNELRGEKTNTYCPFLWEEVFIDPFGDVSFCCNRAPEPIGSIYKNDLRQIWNQNRKAGLFRWMSLNGCLTCFPGCDILSPAEKKGFVRHPDTRTEYPRVVHIMHTFLCNLRCRMCIQPHQNKLSLRNEVMKQKIDWQKIKTVIMQGGEILAVKASKELYTWLTEQAGKKVNIITNGLLINEEWAGRLLTNSEFIEISVNAVSKNVHERINIGSNFNKVIANIKTLVDLKRQHGLPAEVRYHFTIVPENAHETVKAIPFADELGCDRITYTYDIVSAPHFLSRHKQLRERLKKEMLHLIHKGGIKIRIRRNHLEQLGIVGDIDWRNFGDNF